MKDKSDERKNVMLMCLSTPRNLKYKNYYTYEFRGKTDRSVEGYMTNEAPVKRIVKKLHADQGKRLDRIVMICSKEVRNPMGEKELSDELREEYGEKLFRMSPEKYFEESIKKFAKEIDSCYQKSDITFCSVEIDSFVDQAAVAKAVVESADEVMEGYENIDLYIDFNGGPRHVAVLILGLANLMKLRNVNVREITFMDFENKIKEESGDTKKEWIPIEGMDAIFGSVDLVAGINEYVNYGRCRLLEQYFRKCDNENIKRILRLLGDFANNMQLCLTDYVMANKENVKRELTEYLDAEKGSSDVYEIMFSFVVGDIQRGCSQLLEGDLPEMVRWCVDKEFIQQALTFYKECMPAYFWDSGIFRPTQAEWALYDGWQIECETGNVLDTVQKAYDEKYRFMDAKYCWMIHYLSEVRPTLAEKKRDVGCTLDMGEEEEYEITAIIGRQIDGAKEKAGKILYALMPETKWACTTVPPEKYGELKQAVVEYLLIQEQCQGVGRSIPELGDAGRLWSFQEMCNVLRKAAERISGLTSDDLG